MSRPDTPKPLDAQMLKHHSIQSIGRALLLALAFLPSGCGGGATNAGPPTLGPLVRDTPVPVPTQAMLPAAAPSPAATSPAGATDMPVPPTATPTKATTSPAGATNVLITYHKSGGIAGIDETLTVHADGRLELRGKLGSVSAQASPADIQALHTLLTSAEFAALQPQPPPLMPDQFVYELTVPGRAQPIVTADGADMPPVLDQAIVVLEKLKAQVK